MGSQTSGIDDTESITKIIKDHSVTVTKQGLRKMWMQKHATLLHEKASYNIGQN